MSGITSQDIEELVGAFEEQRARLKAFANAQGIELNLGEAKAVLEEKLFVLVEAPGGFGHRLEETSETNAVRLRTTSERLAKMDKIKKRLDRKTESQEWPAAPKIQKAIEDLGAHDSDAV